VKRAARPARIAQNHYFSALAHHLEKSRPGTVKRHTRHLDAISASGIITHLGAFKPKDIRYHSSTCDVRLRRHEEKETGFPDRAPGPPRLEAVLLLPSVPIEQGAQRMH